MDRIRCRVEIRQVTAHAFGRGVGEIPGGVALGTILNVVPEGEGEEVVVHHRGAPTLAEGIVALRTIRGKAGGHVVRVPGRGVIALMAVDAVIPHALEGERVVGLVAIHAAEVSVHTDQGEAVLFMQLGNGIHQPCLRGVASGAVIPHRHGMHVGVA